MSMPSASCWVQMGAMAEMAFSASAQREPLMLELSSTRKIVSKSLRKAKRESWSESVEGLGGVGEPFGWDCDSS